MGGEEGLLLQVMDKDVLIFACDLGGVCYGRSSRLSPDIYVFFKKYFKSEQ